MQKSIHTGTDQLKAIFKNGIITLTLNNPKSKNALSENLTPFLRKILKNISKDSKYKLLVLRGQGDSFCSGGNIKGMEKKKVIKNNFKEKVADLLKKQKNLTGILYSLKIPTIAAITGATAGAGFSLALACDFRIGNQKSFFISNYSKIGLSGDYGISWFLTSLLGEAKAKEIMILNNRIYASEALKLGLLNILFKKDFEKNLNIVCENIISQSNLALRKIKSNIQIANRKNLNELFHYEAKNLIECSESNEHKIAVQNFKKK